MSDDSIGIDISKDRLDAARPSDGGRRSFPNDAAGFRAIRAWLRATPPARVVYEPTGPYHAAFERACVGHLPLVKVNPLQARRFAQARGVRAKTDAVDAVMLAQMGAAFALEPDRPLPESQRDLKELQVERCALVRDRTRLLNRLKTQTLALTKRQTRARLAQLDRQIAATQAAIETRLRDSRPRPLDVLRSIPGIGPVAAAAILIECPEIGTLGRKQAASLAGLAPMARQSGRWQGQAFIQGGRKPLRDALYMPAIVAIRFNPDMRDKYEAMRAAGKPAKVAITAVMRKLLELANALVKADRAWTPKHA
jgi:transposase